MSYLSTRGRPSASLGYNRVDDDDDSFEYGLGQRGGYDWGMFAQSRLLRRVT